MSKARDIADRKLDGTDLTFGDNDKAIFGAGSDLQIYHNGSASVISDTGTGNFFISGDNDVFISKADLSEVKAKFSTNGAVSLYYDNAQKLATTSTGIDVTGTAKVDGLTVDGATTSIATSTLNAALDVSAMMGAGSTLTLAGAGGITAKTWDGATRNRLNIANNGDISFYEDTGTTAKFFWDASAERLGIGTTSPAFNLHVIGDAQVTKTAAGTQQVLQLNNSDTTAGTQAVKLGFSSQGITKASINGAVYGNDYMTFNVGSDTERMRIDASGNVGIGRSPQARLTVDGVIESRPLSGDARIRWQQGSSGAGWLGIPSWDTDGTHMYGPTTTTTEAPIANFNATAPNAWSFRAGATPIERMRIDSAGRVTMPYQPSFRAYNNGTITSTGTTVWNTADHNVGGHYSTTTGIFTAPVSGSYQFNISWVLNDLTSYFWGQLQRNSSTINADFHTTDATTSYQGRSISHTVYLNAGDTFSVYVGGMGGGSIQTVRSSISGHLVG